MVKYLKFFEENIFLKIIKNKLVWFSRDLPSGSGDWEDLKDILNENPTFNCPNPTNM